MEVVDHFCNFLTLIPSEYCGVSSEVLKCILNFECAEEDKNMLVGGVSAEMIRKVLFSLATYKSLGPNGYTTEFFKETWAITKGDLVQAVQSFFNKGFLPERN